MKISRREFVEGAAGAGLLTTLGGLESLLRWSPVSAAETTVAPEMVRFTPEIELSFPKTRNRCNY